MLLLVYSVHTPGGLHSGLDILYGGKIWWEFIHFREKIATASGPANITMGIDITIEIYTCQNLDNCCYLFLLDVHCMRTLNH